MADIYKGLAAAVPTTSDKIRRQREKAIEIQQGAALAQARLQPDMNVRRAGQQIGADTVAAKAQAGQEVTQQEQGQLSQLAGQAAAAESADLQTEMALRGQRQRAGLAEEQQALQLAQSAAEQQQQNQLSKESQELARRMQERGIRVEDQMSFLTSSQQEQLASLARDADEKLFLSRLAFTEQEGQDKFSHQMQVLDWAIASAESKEQYMDRAQEIEQAFEKEQALYRIVIAKLEQALTQEHKSGEQALDQESKRRIEELKGRVKRKQAAKQRDASIVKGMIGLGVGLVT